MLDVKLLSETSLMSIFNSRCKIDCVQSSTKDKRSVRDHTCLCWRFLVVVGLFDGWKSLFDLLWRFGDRLFQLLGLFHSHGLEWWTFQAFHFGSPFLAGGLVFRFFRSFLFPGRLPGSRIRWQFRFCSWWLRHTTPSRFDEDVFWDHAHPLGLATLQAPANGARWAINNSLKISMPGVFLGTFL